jgi:hypothetical protein
MREDLGPVTQNPRTKAVPTPATERRRADRRDLQGGGGCPDHGDGRPCSDRGRLRLRHLRWPALLDAAAILLVQALTAFASIAYLHQLSPCSSRWPGPAGWRSLVTRRLYAQRYQLLGRVVLDVRARREMDTDELQVVRPRNGATRRPTPMPPEFRVQLRSAALRRPFSTRE